MNDERENKRNLESHRSVIVSGSNDHECFSVPKGMENSITEASKKIRLFEPSTCKINFERGDKTVEGSPLQFFERYDFEAGNPRIRYDSKGKSLRKSSGSVKGLRV